MGKSSLMLRTARKLREEGCRIAVLDLTAIGQNLTVEQWYFGLLARTAAAQPKQSEALIAFWKANREMGPMQRFVEALHRILLAPGGNGESDESTPLILFVDEIDAVRSLPFSADEFFGGIRECYNRRVQEPAFEKLTFCLLGVASPTDLVQDTRLSPFNIGQRIELLDFTPDEAAPLARGLIMDTPLEARADRLLRRVLYWTNGHPYMTQRLCQAVARSLPSPSSKMGSDRLRVDMVGRDLFLTQDARDNDDNLMFVRNRLLHSEADVSALLDLYFSVWCGRRVRDDHSNPLCSLLRLSGVAARRGPCLILRNRVYGTVFDKKWVRDNLPGAEVRRQRTAYRAGAMRTASIGGGVVLCVGTLAGVAVQQARVARRAETRANRESERATELVNVIRAQASHGYVETAVRLMNAGDYGAALAPLAEAAVLDRDNPERFALHQQRFAAVAAAAPRIERFWSVGKPVRWATYSPDKRFVVAGGEDGKAHLWNAATGAELPLLSPQDDGSVVTFVVFSPDGTRLITCGNGTDALVWEVGTRRLLCVLPTPPKGADSLRGTHASWSHDGRRVVLARGEQVVVWELGSGTVPITPRLVMRDTSRGARINEAVLSPDGTGLVTAFQNYLGAVINAPRDTLRFFVRTPALGGCYGANHVTWSRDGKRLLVAGWFGAYGENRGTCVFDTRQSVGPHRDRAVLPLLRHAWIGTWADFSPDERQIATASADGTARVWDAQTGNPITPPLVHERPVGQVTFSPSGRRVVSASADGTARIWDAQTGKPVGPPLHHAGAVVVAQFGDDNHVLTASRDGTVRVWALPSSAPFLPSVKEDAIYSLPGDGTHAIVLSMGANTQNRTFRTFDLTTGKPLFPSPTLPAFSRSSFSRDGRRVLLYGSKGMGLGAWDTLRNVQVWDAESGRPLSPLMQADWATLSHDGKKLLLSDLSGVFRLVDVSSGSLLLPAIRSAVGEGFSNNGKGFDIYFDPFSPDDRRLLLNSTPTELRFFDIRTGQPDGPPMPHSAPVFQWAFSPDSRLLFTRTLAGNVRVWNTQNGSPVSASIPLGDRFFSSDPIEAGLTFSPDSKFALTTGSDYAYLWPLASGMIVPEKLPLPRTKRFVFSPDGTTFVAIGQTAWLWRVGAKKTVTSDGAYTAEVRDAAFSPDGYHILVVREDGTASFWDAKNARPSTPLLAQAKVNRAVFSPDGRTAATGTEDGFVRVWDATTGEPVTPPFPMEESIERLEFSADGRRLLVGHVHNLHDRVWNVSLPVDALETMVARALLLSGQREDARIGTIPIDNASLRAAWQRANPKSTP